MQDSENRSMELQEDRIPGTDLECVDEIDDIVCMVAALRNMFFEVADALPCAKKNGIV